MKKLVTIVSIMLFLNGCATGITNNQYMELQTYEVRGLAVNKKSVAGATALGILPGGGSFYGQHYALGILNLITWPLSIMWDPVSGRRAALRINYVETREHVHQLKNQEMNALNQKRVNGLIDDNNYQLELVKISQKYDLNPIEPPVLLTPNYQQSSPKSSSQINKEYQVKALQQQNLPYDEYQRRYQQIMAE